MHLSNKLICLRLNPWGTVNSPEHASGDHKGRPYHPLEPLSKSNPSRSALMSLTLPLLLSVCNQHSAAAGRNQNETLCVLRASQALTRSTLSLSVPSVLKLF